MPDGYQLLADEHRAARAVYERYRQKPEDSIARTFCTLVDRHSALEEAVLYPRVRSLPNGTELASTAELEHANLKHLVARFFETPPMDVRELVEDIARKADPHMIYEEDVIFSLLREQGLDADELGRELEATRFRLRSEARG